MLIPFHDAVAWRHVHGGDVPAARHGRALRAWGWGLAGAAGAAALLTAQPALWATAAMFAVLAVLAGIDAPSRDDADGDGGGGGGSCVRPRPDGPRGPVDWCCFDELRAAWERECGSRDRDREPTPACR